MSSTVLPGPVSTSSPRKLRAWLPTLLWLCVLAYFSTDTFSAEHTGTILGKILHALFGAVSHERFEQIHFLIRKGAHFFSYGLLSALAFFSWRATWPSAQRWSLRWAALGVLTAFAAGSLDEFHQSFVPSRTSSFHDVLLDTAGAIFFQLVIALWIIYRNGRARR
ncbi:MAG TPA: VanZ family protein [Candidatus Angelobacter sp.]|nr:VanZ family protein [Candidatus Angelobacter sp.]